MTDARDRIADHVRANPGVHFNGLVRALDLAAGQVQHHVRTLRADGAITAESLYGRTHYYPPAFDAWERGALALLRRETAADVVATLMADGPARPEAVADALDIARSTLEWHLDRLSERGLVTKRRDGRGRVTLELARPDETARLLDEVHQSFPERMADRFTRLVDNLLSE